MLTSASLFNRTLCYSNGWHFDRWIWIMSRFGILTKQQCPFHNRWWSRSVLQTLVWIKTVSSFSSRQWFSLEIARTLGTWLKPKRISLTESDHLTKSKGWRKARLEDSSRRWIHHGRGKEKDIFVLIMLAAVQTLLDPGGGVPEPRNWASKLIFN